MRADVERALAREAFQLARRCLDGDRAIGGSDAAEYLEFAAATYPPITATRSWRADESRRAACTPVTFPGREPGRSIVLRHHLQWRLWRRYGV